MNSIHKIIGLTAAAAIMLGTVAPALALDTTINGGAAVGVSAGGAGVAAKADERIQARISKAKERADQEIDRRINTLNELNTRVQAMVRVSASEKATVASTAASQISSLTTLKAKIDADTDISVLKTDIQSITANYRIFMLIIPQGRIEVAADKLTTVSTSLTALAAKIKTRIDAGSAAGKDASTMIATYNDMIAKIADIGIQSSAAVSLVAPLTPDNGDKAKQTANEQALKDGRAKIKAGMKDVEDARADARAIIKSLKSFGLDGTASSTSNGSATVQ